MDGRGHKDHEQTCWCDLQRRRCGPHDKTDRPETVSRKRESHHGAAPEARTEIKKIGHPFKGDVDTTDQWNVPDPPLCLGEDMPSDYMGGDSADNNNKEQKQDEDESRPLSGSDIPREVVNQFVECVKKCGKNQECGPGRHEDQQSGQGVFPYGV